METLCSKLEAFFFTSLPSVSFFWQCHSIGVLSHGRHEYLTLVQPPSHCLFNILATTPSNPWLTKPTLIARATARPVPHARVDASDLFPQPPIQAELFGSSPVLSFTSLIEVQVA